MTVAFFVEQALNGFQLGVLLFLLAAGLTLVFGIMDLVNLAHGSVYMVGAFIAATLVHWTGSFIFGILLALPATLAVGVLLEILALRTLYARDHMDQVLATFGLILFFNEGVRLVWGPAGLSIPLPAFLDSTVALPLGIVYPTYRMFIILVGCAVALGLYWLVARTRLGMLIRAGASNREMVGALGIDIRLLFTAVFGIGAMLAGLAGMLVAPISQAQIGMGEQILILAFVVIVIGGIGSVRGAFIAAILIGVIDTLGRSFLDVLLLAVLDANAAEAAGPALSSMLIYVLMAAILTFRPQGLFPPRSG
ncbi:MAG: branched-chain amino acid ABC transporter permease [Alphaproteobacteria bacterium]|jgi:branched-chain amino acid transport system permease protein